MIKPRLSVALVRIFVLSALLAAISLTAAAQSYSSAPRFGAKFGINIATVNLSSSNESVSLDNVVGIVAGMTLDYPLDSKWTLHSGVELSMKGFEYSPDVNTKLTAKATYLVIPFTVGYKFNLGQTWKIEPRLGLFMGFGMGGKTTATAYGASGSVETFGDKILAPFDAGVSFGCFFDNDRFVIGILGESGMTQTNGDNLTITGAKAHSYNISINLGYMF